jgi:hypothetical protein
VARIDVDLTTGVKAFSLSPHPSETTVGVLTARMLRDFPFGQLERMQQQDALAIVANVPGAVLSARLVSMRRPARAGHPDREYAELARRYVELVPGGRPITDLAAQLGRSRTTVRNLIAEARNRCFLTGSQHGKAGGQLTDKARRLLAADKED